MTYRDKSNLKKNLWEIQLSELIIWRKVFRNLRAVVGDEGLSKKTSQCEERFEQSFDAKNSIEDWAGI